MIIIFFSAFLGNTRSVVITIFFFTITVRVEILRRLGRYTNIGRSTETSGGDAFLLAESFDRRVVYAAAELTSEEDFRKAL